MTLARNIAVIALLALAVAFVPGGGNAADAILATISIAFMAAIAFSLFGLYRSQRETVWTLDDRNRAMLFGAVGVIVLCVAGSDKAFDSGGGTLLWIGALGLSIAAIISVWRNAHSYG